MNLAWLVYFITQFVRSCLPELIHLTINTSHTFVFTVCCYLWMRDGVLGDLFELEFLGKRKPLVFRDVCFAQPWWQMDGVTRNPGQKLNQTGQLSLYNGSLPISRDQPLLWLALVTAPRPRGIARGLPLLASTDGEVLSTRPYKSRHKSPAAYISPLTVALSNGTAASLEKG